jgi:hypothetical protein
MGVVLALPQIRCRSSRHHLLNIDRQSVGATDGAHTGIGYRVADDDDLPIVARMVPSVRVSMLAAAP